MGAPLAGRHSSGCEEKSTLDWQLTAVQAQHKPLSKNTPTPSNQWAKHTKREITKKGLNCQLTVLSQHKALSKKKPKNTITKQAPGKKTQEITKIGI